MAKDKLEINMYRYNPEQDKFPYIKNYIIKKTHKRYYGSRLTPPIKGAR